MTPLDLFLTQEETEFPDPLTWFRGGPSHLDNIVSFVDDAYETAEDVFSYGYLTARVAFAASFLFGAAALFSLSDQLLALLESDYIY